MGTKKSKVTRARYFAIIGIMIAIFAFLFTAYSARLIRIGREDGKQQSYVTAVAGVSTDNGVLEIKAGKVRHAETIPSYFELSEDTQALCLNLIVKNISGSEKNFIPLEEIYVQDFEENKYTIEAVPTCSGGVGGPIQTGEVLQGELGFIMPKNKKVEKLVYKPLDNKLKTFIISNIQE